jgi:hypothetical protein
MSEVSIVQPGYIIVEPTHIKRSSKFTCIGWVFNIQIPDEYPIVLLGVSDLTGRVIPSSYVPERYIDETPDSAIRFEIKKYKSYDYKLQFSNSESKPIEQYTGISLNDQKWHFLAYVCNGEGEIHYYIDGIECPCETGVGEEGILYSVSWSRQSRLGGGNIWVPYLYRDWQIVNMYRWRYASGLVLNQGWINEIMNIEKMIFSE